MHEFRPTATHGNRRAEDARSADAAPHMARMEAAAYDVLLHKATWHDPSPARRQPINFMSVPGTGNAGSVVLLQPGATVMVDWIDRFGIYSIDWERRCAINDRWVLQVSKVQQKPECPGDGEERFVVRGTKTGDEPVL